MTPTAYVATPIGTLGITASDTAITRIFFADNTKGTPSSTFASSLLRLAAEELHEYFAGQRRNFTLPLAPEGTEFQRAVWEALRTIPYGETRSYKQIAEQIGKPLASRAVGMADNRNPIVVVIPCHRVVGSNGTLVGYAGGLDKKQWLLDLESAKLQK